MPKRKRRAQQEDDEPDLSATAQNDKDTSLPVHDGMRGGDANSRKTEQNTHVDHVNDGDDVVTDGTFEIQFGDKVTVCQKWHRPVDASQKSQPQLVFTHGAGGGITNAATVKFVEGFAGVSPPVVCFQGTMNLKSRVRTFEIVVSNQISGNATHDSSSLMALGGRSMGARAAVMTANAQEGEGPTEALILVSYPLIGGKNEEMRDQILYDLPEDIDVLFVSGTADHMCPLSRLREVRDHMKARSWLLTVEGADHGMSVKPKAAVEGVRRASGATAARWLQVRDPEQTECVLAWDEEHKTLVVGEWQEPESRSKTRKPGESKSQRTKPATNNAKSETQDTRSEGKRRLQQSTADAEEPSKGKRKTRAKG